MSACSSSATDGQSAILAGYDAAEFWSSNKRNFRGSVRLRQQHDLFVKAQQGTLLHPDIEAFALSQKSSTGSFRVADIGAGNGVWLADLHDHLTTKHGLREDEFQLDGLDVNDVNFPPRETFPANIRLIKSNVFEPAPELVGAYDVVHVRAWSSLISKNDPTRSIAAAISLLKPGGYFQWEEARVDLAGAWAYPATAKRTATDRIIALMEATGAARGNSWQFLSELDMHLARGGLEDCKSRQYPMRPVDYKAWTDNNLMCWEEFILDLLPNASGEQVAEGGDLTWTKQGFGKMLAECMAETEQGVVIHHQQIVMATGRKPL